MKKNILAAIACSLFAAALVAQTGPGPAAILPCQAIVLEDGKTVNIDTVAPNFGLPIETDCFGAIEATWLFKFTAGATAEHWLTRPDNQTAAYFAPDTLPDCPTSGWICIYPNNPNYYDPLSIGILEEGKTYLLALNPTTSDPTISITNCPGCENSGGVGVAYTDSLVAVFALEGILLSRRGEWPIALLYALLSVLGGFAAVWAGIKLIPNGNP